MQKLAWTLVVILALSLSGTGWLYFSGKSELTKKESKITQLQSDIESLKSEMVAKDMQSNFKDEEIKQTNDLLDQCYKALANQNADFDEINRIIQLPKRETYEECNPDQDAACVDFLNRQLLDVH